MMNNTIKKIGANLINSFNGLKQGFKEHSFIIEIVMGVLFVPLVLLIDRPNLIKAMILLTYFFLLSLEIMNTAIERLCDRITTDFDRQIKEIKDLSSASVFITVLLLLLEILFLFFNFPEL